MMMIIIITYYFSRQDSEAKKCEKKEVNGPPLQTASMSVRALIEEKIIQKRNTNTQNVVAVSSEFFWLDLTRREREKDGD